MKGTLMIDLRVIMACVASCFWLGACAGPEKTTDRGGVATERDLTGGEHEYPTEVREEHHDDGTLSVRTEGYVDDQGNFVSHGRTTAFWPNGRKKLEITYVHGMKHGPRTAWYENGQVWSQGRFVNNRTDGALIEWFPTGRKASEMHIVDGALHGMFAEWHPNGQMKLRVEFVKGQRQGTMTEWDENGVIVKETDYVDGVAQP